MFLISILSLNKSHEKYIKTLKNFGTINKINLIVHTSAQ